MSVTLSILYNLVDNLLEIFKFYLINKYILGWKTKKWDWKKTIIAGIGLLGITLFFTVLSAQINPLIFYVAFILVESFIVFEEAPWKVIIINLTDIYLIYALDTIVHKMYLLLGNLIVEDIQISMKLIVSITTAVFLGITSYGMRYKMQGYIKKIPVQYYILFICLATGNTILLGVFEDVMPKDNTGICIVYIFIVLGVFLEMALLLMLAATREIYKEKDLLNQKYLKWQEEHYKYLEQRETDTKKFRHDMRSHVYMLNHLLEQGEVEEVKKYIDEIDQHFAVTGKTISVNNGIVDAILNRYGAECEEKNISLTVEGHMPSDCKIAAFDLCVIFSNLLSNAVEATVKCEDKKIILDLRYGEDMIMLSIKNTFDGKIIEKNGSIQTRKKNNDLHGYGLSNIKECVEQNQGHMKIREEGEYFIVEIYITN